ncbi:hypothetical protein NA56DRAFT_694968 [Hyaloscypha hepaticicola]|uniref:NACHT domain-containing protein n=1 Tax=Hyaloscypha hepaticicola TaxID=2082293 RepID=A0A2J6PGR7_9HELO|nr:hypothetical protein NA56DRAFT_694968 [Hyaloscypha hepaticicola]
MEDIFGISIIHDPGPWSNFDLLAVHGIKGHPYDTWTHPNGEKWLENYLPKDLPNTRIMTFGYNAQVFTSSKGHITDFAEQLLQHFTSIRRSTQSLDRPIIFLCHSLGGLVVKKALLLAQEIHDAAGIRTSTRAVAFMGTPHRGSQLASYADIAVKCMKAAGVKANIANIHQLKLDSDNLEELALQFGSLLQTEQIKVLTFYELKPIKLAGLAEVVVVPTWSAKLGLGPPLESIIPVDADHRQIAQFPSQNCKQYSVVRSNIVYITSMGRINGQLDDLHSQDMKWEDIRLWLDAVKSPLGSAINKERADGTCEWVLEKEAFNVWRSSESSGGLWICGKPGVGKTILANFISEDLLKTGSDQAVLTMHCHSYRSLNDPAYALIRGILHQALQAPLLSETVKRRLLELHSQTSAMSDIVFDTLLNILDDILRTKNGINVIIDGIDEIDESASEIELLLTKAKTWSQSATTCKVLILSRNTAFLDRLLDGWKTMTISSHDSLRDISIFLNEKLENITHLGDRRAEVAEKLLHGSKGLFLWAGLTVSELDHLRTWNEVQALLQNGNRGLDATYATIIKQLDTSSEGLCRIRARALPLVAVACRPFRLEELTELLAVEVSKEFLDPGNKLLGGWSTLSRACGPFLQINESDVIELIHVSAKEFLLSHSLAQSLCRDYLIDESAETEMACLCLSYLNFTVFGRRPGEEMRLDVNKLDQEYPLLEYASNFWADHFLRSGKVTALQLGLLYQFLNSPCSINWVSTIYKHFALKCGENHGTILTAQKAIFVNLQKKLRTSGGIDPVLSTRCVDKCGRLLLESTQDALRIEQFHSGPTAEATLEKKLRVAQCYGSLFELDPAQETATDAFETAQHSIGTLHPITLQLERIMLYTQAQVLERSSTLKSYDTIPRFLRLVENHVEVFGPDHIETFFCRHDFGLMYSMRSEFAQAREVLERLHQEATQKLGRTSRVTHPIANNLAACANMQGDYDFAESILQTIPGLSDAAAQQLEVDITTVPTYTLHALSILAAVFGARDEDHRSEILHQRVIDGLTAQLRPKAHRVYESAINKGQALRDQFKYDESRKHYMEWLKKSNHDFGTDSNFSQKIRDCLIDVQEQEKKWNEMSEGLKIPPVQEQLIWERS